MGRDGTRMRLSVIVNCCYEGLLLHRALASAAAALGEAGLGEAEAEIILVADAADAPTAAAAADAAGGMVRLVKTGFGDLGLARNAGVAAAAGEFVLFLDADDLWSRNWVDAAWRSHLDAAPLTVLHPQYSVFFGRRAELLVHADWRDAEFDPRLLVARNAWTSGIAARRELLLDLPYPAVRPAVRLGFEDWSWNARAAARGIRHAVVPGTAHFIRLKAGGSMQDGMREFFPVPSGDFADMLAQDDPTRPHDL